MSPVEENHTYLDQVILPALGVPKGFLKLADLETDSSYFVKSFKTSFDAQNICFDFRFERNVQKPTDQRFFLNKIRVMLKPDEGMPQIIVFKLFRQKGKNMEEMELEVQKLHLERNIAVNGITQQLMNKRQEIKKQQSENKKMTKRKTL